MNSTEDLMKNRQKIALQNIQSLFSTQRLAVLATQYNGYPYTSLMAFASTSDLKNILLLTSMSTTKYDYLTACPNVSLLIHNSQNFSNHKGDDVAVTAIGTASTVSGLDKKKLLATFLDHHPSLTKFALEQTTALISVAITKYIMVSQFQNKIEIPVSLSMSKINDPVAANKIDPVSTKKY
ncbi:pyridoxamine 5'-phosphate oxidase family protein [Desulfamplus magnetovallimortis]|uniref:pyridoxamine 5'-phosphate oxidase family protein n=1 Tax=Desulfamplus magnetovallimortis TaxID=1246637 RepID=UPI001FEA245D|nr:pyridoxamine 5'-phosphate oxidase family protein [Desulfamplus magnetovallimortis]